MKKLSKTSLKRLNSIPWDTKEYLTHPIQLTFPWSRWLFNPGQTEFIQDFYLSESDKYPFCSLISDIKDKSRALISFGHGKKAIYKKLSSAETNWTMDNVRASMDGAAIGLNIPINNRVEVKFE